MEISTNCAPAAPGAPTDAHEKIDGLDRAAWNRNSGVKAHQYPTDHWVNVAPSSPVAD